MCGRCFYHFFGLVDLLVKYEWFCEKLPIFFSLHRRILAILANNILATYTGFEIHYYPCWIKQFLLMQDARNLYYILSLLWKKSGLSIIIFLCWIFLQLENNYLLYGYFNHSSFFISKISTLIFSKLNYLNWIKHILICQTQLFLNSQR